MATTEFHDDACEFMSVLEEINRFKKMTSARIKYYDHLALRKDEEPLTNTFDDIDKL